MSKNFLSEMSRNDKERSFAGTYIGIIRRHCTPDGSPSEFIAPAYVAEALEHGFIVRVAGNSSSTEEIPYSSDRIVLEHPGSGMVFVGSKVLYLERRNSRQWKRGARRREFACYWVGATPESCLPTDLSEVGFVSALDQLFNKYASSVCRDILSRDVAVVKDSVFLRTKCIGYKEQGKLRTLPSLQPVLDKLLQEKSQSDSLENTTCSGGIAYESE